MNCFASMFVSHIRENEASLAVLPDLLMELDSMNEVPFSLWCDALFLSFFSPSFLTNFFVFLLYRRIDS